MFKNMDYYPNMFTIPNEVRGFSLKFLFYDYLPKLSLSNYISQSGEKINEIHAKYICYQLLISIGKLHANNICHNNIDTSNIMFDNDLNLKIIHFCEANIINENIDKYKFNIDFFGIGKILIKLITLGQFDSIIYNKKKKAYQIFSNKTNLIKGKDLITIEESNFLEKIKNLFNVNISKQF